MRWELWFRFDEEVRGAQGTQEVGQDAVMDAGEEGEEEEEEEEEGESDLEDHVSSTSETSDDGDEDAMAALRAPKPTIVEL
jgi:hypothetical protein